MGRHSKFKFRLALGAVLVSGIVWSGQNLFAAGKDKLVLSSFRDTPVAIIGMEILKSAYARLGIEVEFLEVTPSRALIESTSGKTDGEVLRIARIGIDHPTLLRVDPPLITLRLVAFTNKKDVLDAGADGLSQFRVGRLKGVVAVRRYTKGFEHQWAGDSHLDLFKMLEADRLDAVIASTVVGEVTTRKLKLQNILKETVPLIEFNVYHYLHESNADLVEDISRVLEEMVVDGSSGVIFSDTVDKMAGS